MPQLTYEICDQCGSESQPHTEYSKDGWAYVGFHPKVQGPIQSRVLCPKCSVGLKKFLNESSKIRRNNAGK